MFSLRRALALLPVLMTINMVIAAPVPQQYNQTGPSVAPSESETRKINGKDIQIHKVPAMDQIPEATTYKVVGGWDGKSSQAAIVRIWKTKDKRLIDNIESSIDLLKDPAVKLLYHSERNDKGNSEWEYILVTKDMRENYPKEGAPDIARLQDWVFRDTYMDLGDAVDKVRKAAIKKAEEMAKDDKIVFRDISPFTVWTDKKRDVVYFDVYLDAVRIKDGSDSEEGKKALKDMRKQAEENFTEDSVRKAFEEATAET